VLASGPHPSERVAIARALDERWYRDLVAPVRGPIEAVVRRVRRPELDPWALPRTGLGGALVLQIARGFGTRRWQEGARVGTFAIEAYNYRVHQPSPSRAARSMWLERDLERVRRVWRSLLEREDALVERVVGRLFGSDSIADSKVPEAVLFLRAAAAAGVLAGDVPDAIHGELDRVMTYLGLAWEDAHGTLDREGWAGALAALGIESSDDLACGELARSRARSSLARLPASIQVELLESALGGTLTEAFGSRATLAWAPAFTPDPLRRASDRATESPVDRFASAHRDAISDEMRAIVKTRSLSFERAMGFLTGQGGKRIRPLLTLACAEAAGGTAPSALRVAAIVEWLHQASLIVDDVVDEAALRRGAPSLHVATSIPFAFGVAAHVLLRARSALRRESPEIRTTVLEAAGSLVEGQRAELLRTGDTHLALTEYYRIVDRKTAELFGCALAVGALSAGAPPPLVRAAFRAGREAGLAFQIIDDVLDYVGLERELGKSPGADLRARRVTMPIVMLRSSLEGPDRVRLDRAFEAGAAPGDEELVFLREGIRDHHIDEACLARAHTHFRRACEALAVLPSAPGRALVIELMDRMLHRRA
jgi:octaprenyl-diphosphate synthase